MGWIMCVGCGKLQRDFVARTFALIAPVQYVLQQVWFSYETIPNAPKHNETHQNMSLGSNGMDRVNSLQKNPMRIRGTNFCINCSSSAYILQRVSCSNKTIQNAPNYYKTHQYMSLGTNEGDRVGQLWKILMRLHGTNLCFNCTISNHFAPSFVY